MNIGLIAHDSKKKLMQNFCIAYKGILNKNQLFATGTTGRLIEEVTNLSVHKFLAGHLGGDQQLCAQIEHNQIDLVIFLREAENPLAHEPDSDNICKLCDMYNIHWQLILQQQSCLLSRLSEEIWNGEKFISRIIKIIKGDILPHNSGRVSPFIYCQSFLNLTMFLAERLFSSTISA